MKKFISLALAVLMLTSLMPLNAFAAQAVKTVDSIVITLDKKIAGKTPEEYKDFITVSGEGVEMGSEGFTRTVYADEQFWQVVYDAEIYEEGTSYTSYFRIYPQEGYVLPYDTYLVSVNYNGEEFNAGQKGQISFTTGEYTDDHRFVKYYDVMIKYRAEEPEPTGLARIPYAISQFFLSIAAFFTETLIQPIADLIMKIA